MVSITTASIILSIAAVPSSRKGVGMEVLIDNQQDLLAIPNANLKRTARDILSVLGCHDGELSLLIVDDNKIRPLNEQYRGRAGATNVLAFPMNEGAFAEVMPHLLGDVVISVETCLRELYRKKIVGDKNH